MASKEKMRDAKELYDLKQRATNYYKDNGIPAKMEAILNAMFYDNPDDVYGHLANYFDGFSKQPLLSKLKAKEVLDARGQPCINTDVFCIVRNEEKLIASSISSTESYPSDNVKPEEKEIADKERKEFVTKAVEYVNEQLNTALLKMNPLDQLQVDTLIQEYFAKMQKDEEEKLCKDQAESGESIQASPSDRTPETSPTKKAKSPKGKKGPAVVIVPDEPREVFICGCAAASAVSQAVCKAAAIAKRVPLYEHIASIRCHEMPEDFSLPLPMVTILTSGKSAPGKLNAVKEFMVVPKPGMMLSESMKHIAAIHEYCAKSLSSKVGMVGRLTTDSGALFPPLDRIEQGLDLLQEAITHLGLTPGEHFNIALNCAGQEMFDYDKGKYDVITGVPKVAEDLGDFWNDITNRYPSVIALIDPMRKQEKEGWVKLCEKLSEKCYVIGDEVHHRPALLKDEDLSPEIKTSGVVLRLEHAETLSDVISAAKKMEDVDNQLVIAASAGDTTDTFLADMAVGLSARFLKLGGLQQGEKVAKLNRLLEIEERLEENGKLSQWSEHVFPLLKPPTPPPEEEEQVGEGGQIPTEEKK